MFQKKFVTILLVAAAATIAVLAAPAVGGTTLGLAAYVSNQNCPLQKLILSPQFSSREPEVYERALAFEGAPLQTREVDAATDFAERSIDDALDLEQREETDGVELEEREFDDELEERSFEDGVELDEREVADEVELYERAKGNPPIFTNGPIFTNLSKKKNSQQAPTTPSRARPPRRKCGTITTIRNLFKKKT